MSESLLQKPMGILGLVGASIAGPYFFVNGSSPTGQPTPTNQSVAAESYKTPSNDTPSYNAPSYNTPSYQTKSYDAQSYQSGTASSLISTPSAGTFAPEQNKLVAYGSNPATGSYVSSNGVITTMTGPVYDFREVLRFDMTPAALMQRFQRITTVLSETQFDGMRVPFVSGTMPTDIAGSLSYFFDRQQSLRRVHMT